MIFRDRKDAGKLLAKLLKEYENNKSSIVIGLPRGGVVVAAEVAHQLKLPLDILCPRKLGAPYQPELAIGAVTETGEGILNEDVIAAVGASKAYLDAVIKKQTEVAQQRAKLYRKGRALLDLKDKIVILVDDGLATGATMKAAIASAKALEASKIVVAVPVAPEDTLNEIGEQVDEVKCIETPYPFYAVGAFYSDFSQTEDDEVIHLLQK